MKKLAITAAIASLLLTSCSGTPSQSDRSDNLETLPPQIERSAEQKSEMTEEPAPNPPQPRSDGASDADNPSAEGAGSSSEEAEDQMPQQTVEPKDSSEETSTDEAHEDSTDTTSVSDTADDHPIGTDKSASFESSVVAGDETGNTVSDEGSEASTEEPRKRWRVRQ